MRKYILLITIIITAFVACNKINTPPALHNDRLAKLLLKDTLQLYVGESRNVPLTISPSNYNLDSLKYLSSDTTVITISKVGVLAAKKVGLSIITISNLTSTISINCHITVVPAPIDSLKLGLIAYYPFNSSTADSSGLGNNGTAYNLQLVPDRFGNPNAAYHFNGVSSYIQVKDNAALRLNNTDFTFNVWAKIDTYSSSYGSVILGKRGPGDANGWLYGIHGYALPNNGATVGQTTFQVSGGNDPFAGGVKTINTNTWYMLTTTYSVKKQQISFYVNGVLDNTINNIPTPIATANSDMFIGSDNPVVGGASAYYFKGSLDDIRIYSRALDLSEIQKLYLFTN
jgi:hypothetical protein